jgi:hypothetical protein
MLVFTEEGRNERSGANCKSAAVSQVGWSLAIRNCFSAFDKTFNASRSRCCSSFFAAAAAAAKHDPQKLMHEYISSLAPPIVYNEQMETVQNTE